MKIQSPEEFIQNHVAPQKSLIEIREEFRVECGIMELYKGHVMDETDLDFARVVVKVNFLMGACLNKNQSSIDKFLVEYGKIYEAGNFGLDWNKILNENE